MYCCSDMAKQMKREARAGSFRARARMVLYSLVFHAPYYKSNYFGGAIDCEDSPSGTVSSDLKSYYKEMLGDEVAETIFDRTMSYCSQSDGWMLTGNDAGLLYGLTNVPKGLSTYYLNLL